MKKYSMLILFMFALITLTSGVCYSAEIGTITGKVVDEKSGEGIEDVTIKIREKNNLNTTSSTTTDKHGQFLLKDVPQAEYYIYAEKIGYASTLHTRGSVPIVKCVANQTTSINFKFQRDDYGLSGIVTDINTKSPIKEARIILESSKDGEKGKVTDEYGKFIFWRVKPGVYTIKVYADGYMTYYLPDIIHHPLKEKIYSITLEPIPEIITQTFPVKYLSVDEIIKRLRVMKSKEGTIITGSDSLIVTDTKENLKKIGDIIEQLDVPPVQIQLEVKLLLASSEKENKSAMPKELDNIAKQLKTLFRYKNYEILDDAQYVALEKSNGSFLIGKGEYTVSIEPIDFLDVNGGLIKLEKFRLLSKTGKRYTSIFNTTVNIPNGDTVILGASNVDASGKALIIAVTAKTMEME